MRIRQMATASGHTSYEATLTTYIKSLAKLMEKVKGSTFDGQKVRLILGALKERVEKIEDDLKQNVTTVLPEEEVCVIFVMFLKLFESIKPKHHSPILFPRNTKKLVCWFIRINQPLMCNRLVGSTSTTDPPLHPFTKT